MKNNTKMDVLAVMDRAISKVEASTSHTVYVGGDEGFVVRQNDLGLREARNAVAELIEAATDARSALHSCIDALSSDEQDDHDALDRLNAALARVGGAS